MRLNEPVTTCEVAFPEGQTLVSRTDAHGRIVFVNKAFTDISGFSHDELIGAPHNIVRHPDMPPEAFQNLWSTIKAGRPWEGLVKNRTKNGDFYWVRANVTPVVEDGQVTGYISIRSKANQAKIVEAEAAYARLRTRKRAGVTLHDGELRGSRLLGWLGSAWQSVAGRLALGSAVGIAALLTVAWLGISGMRSANGELHQISGTRMLVVGQIAGITEHLRDNLQEIMRVSIDLRVGDTAKVAHSLDTIRTTTVRINEAWDQLIPMLRSQMEHAVAGELAAARATFLKEGMAPAMALAERGDVDALETHLEERLLPLFRPVGVASDALAGAQQALAAQASAEADLFLDRIVSRSIMVGSASVAIMLAMAILVFVTMRRPLRRLEEHFRAMA